MDPRTKEAIDTMHGLQQAANRQNLQAEAIRQKVIQEALDALAAVGIRAEELQLVNTQAQHLTEE